MLPLLLFIIFSHFPCTFQLTSSIYGPRPLTTPELLEIILNGNNTNIDIDKTIEALISLKQQRNETKIEDPPRQYLLKNGKVATAGQMADDILKELSIRHEKAKAVKRVQDAKDEEERREMGWKFTILLVIVALVGFFGYLIIIIRELWKLRRAQR